MKYSIITTCDKSYFPHLKILVNSILDVCDLTNIKSLFIIDNGLDTEQKQYFIDKSNIINIITTGMQTNFNGGTWGEDWQKNVKSKTVYLYDIVYKIQEPVLMLDADMMVTKDLHTLLDRGGDLQLCVRPGNAVKYIGSYVFVINAKKSLPFIQEWKELTQQAHGTGAYESPALTKIAEKYKNLLDIVEINQDTVNRIEYPPTHETIVVHFKGSSLHKTFDEQFNNRITTRAEGAWNLYINKYLK
jgi:hypothetical protein